ncbi:hypothetical protein F4780DRAFT_437446 [Xylariomycetidae sp. FL0641]|nr:hypothetical protein F4780DRAFT_437446 [Xylariomycetidae sp. FL0641]
MTYPGAFPPGQGSGFDRQQNQNHPYTPNVQNGYNAWQNQNPQLQQQYQNAAFAPVAYQQLQQQQQQQQPQSRPPPPLQPRPQLPPQPQMQQPQQQQQQQQQHRRLQPQAQHNGFPQQYQFQQQYPHQQQPQRQQQQQRPLPQSQPQLQPRPMQPGHNANLQFQMYNPSAAQKGHYGQPAPQNNVNANARTNASPQMIPSPRPPMQQVPNQQQRQQQPQPQQPQHYTQQVGWQQMPPPTQSPIPVPVSIPSPAVQHPMPQSVNSPVMAQSPQVPPQFPPNTQHRTSSASVRVEQANRVSASPRLTSQAVTRSPSVSSTRSPAPGLVPHHQDTNSLLLCVAEDLFAKARRESRELAETVDAKNLQLYQKLVATGLGCLEVSLGSNKLAPRLEALVRLRYASILSEETNNIMEAETALTKGITLCERNRFADLKYAMQFLQVKLLYSQGKERAAMIAVDGRIRDAEVVKHVHWQYAFRFLKASFYLQSFNPTETHALENLRAIGALAVQRSDHAICVVASLVEGLSLLKVMKDDAVVRIQACIAQASKYQFENSAHVIQLEVLALMLDLACSLHQKSPQAIAQKLKALQDRMDGSIQNKAWGFAETQLLLPIRKPSTNFHTISSDTSGILRPGAENDAHDYLAMSFWSKLEAFTMTYTYSGLALLYQQPRNNERMFALWDEALGQIEKSHNLIKGIPNNLEEAIKNCDWRREVKCYLQILRGLHFATSTRWTKVKDCVSQLEKLIHPAPGNLIVLYTMYLAGAYHQGTGDLKGADEVFSHDKFSLDPERPQRRKPAELDVAILANFNLIWIRQHPSRRDDSYTQVLLDQLRPLCADHPNLEIRTAYNLVLAAIQTEPPTPMTAVKTHISAALNNAKALGDVQTLSIALNLMRAKLFQSIVGDQALKSAKAASTQAKKSGNTLWMSVADGMLAQSFDVQGQTAEAQKAWQDAITYSTQAFKTG